MQSVQLIERLINLVDPAGNVFLNLSADEALARLASGDPEQVRGIDGQFALVHKQGKIVRMARSIGRPLRYFIAKQHAGPVLVIAERIDAIWNWLKQEGLDGQFHPSYTRMVPAHHLTELALVGCPDPSPTYTRFFNPQRNRLGTNLDEIGEAYIGALATELNQWLDRIEPNEPIGVLFSGGIDSGAVLVTLYHLLLKRGEAPQRLKAFTLDVAGDGADARQALRSALLPRHPAPRPARGRRRPALPVPRRKHSQVPRAGSLRRDDPRGRFRARELSQPDRRRGGDPFGLECVDPRRYPQPLHSHRVLVVSAGAKIPR